MSAHPAARCPIVDATLLQNATMVSGYVGSEVYDCYVFPVVRGRNVSINITLDVPVLGEDVDLYVSCHVAADDEELPVIGHLLRQRPPPPYNISTALYYIGVYSAEVDAHYELIVQFFQVKG